MLSQSTGYAAMALGYIAGAGGKPMLVKQIAEAANIPASYLSKIIHSLARKGLVTTQRGIGGGVTLARPATEITLYELCQAMDEPAVMPRCMLGTAVCSDERACPAHKFWSAQRERGIDHLRSMTIADIAAFEQQRRNKGAPAFPPFRGPPQGAAAEPQAVPAALTSTARPRPGR